MKRIAFVNQRYGMEVNGGSEYYTRLIAEHLTDRFAVDVITTKALDYTTWENHYTAADEIINGVHVRRFPVEAPRAADFNQYNEAFLRQLAQGNTDMESERLWFAKQGPYCPAATEYIRMHKNEYDALIFVTYLYYPTVMGLPEAADRAVFIPTAHDEPYIHFQTYKRLFRLPRAFLFLTEEERSLVQKLFHTEDIPCDVAGVGVEITEKPDADRFRRKHRIGEDYLLYAGRIDEGKNCPELFRYFLEYKRRHPRSTLKLVLMGNPVCRIPEHEDILSLGFVEESDKLDGISGARALVLPSKFESLSISVLEAMALHVPVIVNGACEVLRGHCRKSNAGLYYGDYFEFEGCVAYLLSHPAEYAQMCENAGAYIERNYRWDVITERIAKLINAI